MTVVRSMNPMWVPEGYESPLNIRETEIAIKCVKDFFEKELARQLNLTRVSAPFFGYPDSGLNDTLNGVERPVHFGVREQEDREVEIVHSLAKWKRFALKRYGFKHGEGLYADMYAIRRDEDTDHLHSILVDQWDWERIIDKAERNEETLKAVVKKVYKALKNTEKYMAIQYEYIEEMLPSEISFITTQELEDMYPDLPPKEREREIVRLRGAVFLMKIGGALGSGEIHDGRAPDYDDWELNGDILVYYPLLDTAFELSSMGIRVDEDALMRQLEVRGCVERKDLMFHKALLNGELPYTIGGGIGQARICMFYLRKAHIGEVIASVWPDEVVEALESQGVHLL